MFFNIELLKYTMDELQIGNFNLKSIQDSLAIAETLARVSMMTSPAAKKRLAARSLELKFGTLDETSGDFVPPRQLLIYLVRMGSFTSVPKIINPDSQDSNIKLPDGLSRHELIQYCQKQQQLHPMVKRAFRKARESQDTINCGIKYRKLNALSKGCSEYTSSPFCLRVFQWNVLAQALGRMNDHFARCPDEALDWNFRKYHMVEEIIEYCPDVICLQEVDHFNFLKHVLNTQGYVGMFFPKPDSPCIYIDGNNGPDGCAMFFRKNKFDLVRSECRILEIWRVQSNQVSMLAILKIKETGQEICLVTTHLKARKGALLSTFRNEQGKDLLQFILNHSENRPTVICGDFNAEPNEPVYATVIGNPALELSSAYADCQPLDVPSCEPAYTTWKIRDEGEICHTIDYIFYSKNKMEVESVLELPTGEEIGQDRIPSFSYPSDHFSMVCDFKLGNKSFL